MRALLKAAIVAAVMAGAALAFDAACLMPIVTDTWTPLELGPMAWYEAENNALDSSGNGYAGTWSGTAAYATGKVGYAYALDGTNYVSINSVVPFNVSSNFSFSVWAYATDLRTASAKILGQRWSSAANTLWYFGAYANKLRLSYYNTAGARSDVDISVTNATNEWAMYSFVVGSTNIVIYKNGQMIGAPATLNQNIRQSATELLRIGYSADPAWMFNGALDDVVFTQRALTPAEVALLYSESVLQSAKGVPWK